MVKLQIDLNENEDKIVEIYKAKNRLGTKQMAIKEIIKKVPECTHKFELVDPEKYYNANGRYLIQRCINCGLIKKDDVVYGTV